jgi:hypothetical protein
LLYVSPHLFKIVSYSPVRRIMGLRTLTC